MRASCTRLEIDIRLPQRGRAATQADDGPIPLAALLQFVDVLSLVRIEPPGEDVEHGLRAPPGPVGRRDTSKSAFISRKVAASSAG